MRISVAVLRVARHENLPIAVRRHGTGVITETRRSVVKVGPQRDARAGILDRCIIAVRSASPIRKSGHEYIAAAVHRYRDRVVVSIGRAVVAVRPKRYAALGMSWRAECAQRESDNKTDCDSIHT